MEKLTLQSHGAGARSFRDFYKSMDNTPPKKAFVKRIAEITMRSETTVAGLPVYKIQIRWHKT